MKKYVLGLVAIVLAVGFSAYTKPAKNNKLFSKTFFYSIQTYGVNDVQDETKWATNNTDPGFCNSGSQRACAFTIPDAYANGTALASGVEVIASQDASGNYYVSDVRSGGSSISPTLLNAANE
jgi:uncharacterized protein YxeA